jgi:hypothetical protein
LLDASVAQARAGDLTAGLENLGRVNGGTFSEAKGSALSAIAVAREDFINETVNWAMHLSSPYEQASALLDVVGGIIEQKSKIIPK